MPTNDMTPTLGTRAGAIVDAATYPHNTLYAGVPAHQWRATAAHRYARHGLKVGPLEGKAPLAAVVPHGFKDFTNDARRVRAWWGKYPTANIGANPPRGVVVIDIDVKLGGIESWAQLTTGHVVPETLTVLTGSGGWHLWFRLPYQGKLRGQLTATDSGIDVKTHTGYLVMPPSVHPVTGGLYLLHTWAPIAPLPQWLYRHVYAPLRAPRPARPGLLTIAPGDGAGLIRAVAESGEGQRNKVLFWAACRAAEDGLDIDGQLIDAGAAAGLPEWEARRTVASAHNQIAGGVAA